MESTNIIQVMAKSNQTNNWLDNYNDSEVHVPKGFHGDGYTSIGNNFNPAWGGQFQMGGSLPGAIGMMYSRQGAPSNGKYAKKTMASAQNGKEMQYYQQGLDWQPKTISQNGTWLDKFQEEHPSVRSIQNDTMNRKIQEYKGRDKETTVTQKDNARIIIPKEIKKLTGKQQNELAQRKSEEQANKDWVKGSMEEAYKSPLMSPGYFTPEGMTIGAMQGTTKLGPDLYDSNYKEAALDALTILPETGNIAKALGPSEGLLSNAYKVNPWVFKPNPESYYRMIGDEGLSDLQNVGHVRSNPNTFYADKHPFFSKGYPIDGRIGDSVIDGAIYSGNNMIEVGGNNEIGNRFVKNRWADAAPDPNIFVARDKIAIDNPNLKVYKKDWLQGYKEVPKQKDGGVIKDDRGQWDHPGEITEISGDTMATHGYGDIPLYVVPDKGKPRMVQPNTGIQKFPGAKKFTEYPIAKNGLRQEQKGLQNLDNLVNFTNYNTKQPEDWLNKYN